MKALFTHVNLVEDCPIQDCKFCIHMSKSKRFQSTHTSVLQMYTPRPLHNKKCFISPYMHKMHETICRRNWTRIPKLESKSIWEMEHIQYQIIEILQSDPMSDHSMTIRHSRILLDTPVTHSPPSRDQYFRVGWEQHLCLSMCISDGFYCVSSESSMKKMHYVSGRPAGHTIRQTIFTCSYV